MLDYLTSAVAFEVYAAVLAVLAGALASQHPLVAQVLAKLSEYLKRRAVPAAALLLAAGLSLAGGAASHQEAAKVRVAAALVHCPCDCGKCVCSCDCGK